MANGSLLVASLSLGFVVLCHAAATIWWASKITEALANINKCLSRIDKELERRDTQIAAVWKRVDELRDMIPTPK